jgi:hypothetical protein
MMNLMERKPGFDLLSCGRKWSYARGEGRKDVLRDLMTSRHLRDKFRGSTVRVWYYLVYPPQTPTFLFGEYKLQNEQAEITIPANPYAGRLHAVWASQKAARFVGKGTRRLSLPLRRLHWLRKYAGGAAKEILEFCQQQGILNGLKSATSLAEKCFWSSDIKLEKEIDPETGDTQIVMALSIRNKSREEVLAAYSDYRKQLIKIVPSQQRSLIRLSYDLL